MQISFRELMTALHGLGFAALFLLGFSGALVEIPRLWGRDSQLSQNHREGRLLPAYLVGMAILAWAAVFTGAYIVYPWYRAHPPAGLMDLSGYPQRSLLSNPSTAGWHNLGMEWKEHVAWFAPIAMTITAYVTLKYRFAPLDNRAVWRAVFAFVLAAFLAGGIAGIFGAFINKHAPIQGGAIVNLGSGTK